MVDFFWPDLFFVQNRLKLFLLFLVAIVTISGCAFTEVKPWQKGILARKSMSFNTFPLESQFRNHVYASREGATGGGGVNIGSCGCN